MHLDHLGPESLDPAQDGLLVLRQRDPQAEDVSAKRALHQPRKTSPNGKVLGHQPLPGKGSAGLDHQAAVDLPEREIPSLLPQPKQHRPAPGTRGQREPAPSPAPRCLWNNLSVNCIRFGAAPWKGQATLLSETTGLNLSFKNQQLRGTPHAAQPTPVSSYRHVLEDLSSCLVTPDCNCKAELAHAAPSNTRLYPGNQFTYWAVILATDSK